MNSKREDPLALQWKEPGSIRTTFLELLEELSRLTTDDAMVMLAVKNLFQSYRVRSARSLAPVRLVGTGAPAGRVTNVGVRLRARHSF